MGGCEECEVYWGPKTGGGKDNKVGMTYLATRGIFHKPRESVGCSFFLRERSLQIKNPLIFLAIDPLITI